jgi:carboxymethylenebutenolidase
MREDIIDVETADGDMETFLCRPERDGPYPAVFLLMDAPGIREELYDMARRLATGGYFVVLPNLYYRAGRDTKYGIDALENKETNDGLVGVHGYCMSGPYALAAAARYPSRIGAAASFYGTWLISDDK